MFSHVSKAGRKEIMKDGLVRLNLGSGQEKLPGEWINADFDEQYNPDVVCDFTDTPWPFPNNYANVVWSSHVIEHLPDHKPFLFEIYRVSKPGAKLVLMFPHYSRVWFSNQHLRAYGIKLLSGYGDMFKVESIRLKYTWWGWNHWHRFPVYAVISVIEFFANLSPEFWERVWCYWFGGFDQVIIEARVVKDKDVKLSKVHEIT